MATGSILIADDEDMVCEPTSRQRRMSVIVERLHSVLTDLETERAQPRLHEQETEAMPLGTLRTLAACLSDLLVMWSKPAAARGLHNLCELLDCPQRPLHRQALVHAIDVLERTKDNFKSKQLAELRANLEHSLRSM